MVQVIAVLDRVNVESLQNETSHMPIENGSPEVWQLIEHGKTNLRGKLATVVARIICQHMQFFKENFQSLIISHIPHPYQEEMKLKSNIVRIVLSIYKLYLRSLWVG